MDTVGELDTVRGPAQHSQCLVPV